MSNELVLTEEQKAAKNFTWWLYLTHIVTHMLSLGSLSLIPVIINYVKRGEGTDALIQSHHRWMIKVFWGYVIGMVVGWILIVSIVGILIAWIVFPGVWLWTMYRLIKGLMDLNADKAMPA